MTPTTRILLVLISTVGWLGLAVAGFGGVAAFFANPARTALAAVLGALAVAGFFAGGNVSPGVREDRGNRWVLWVFSAIGLAAGYLPAWSDRHAVWLLASGAPGEALRWAGVVLFAAGGALRLWPVFVLGDRFSGLVAIQPGHRLETGGLYRLVRHPSYLGLLVMLLGWALGFRSGLGVALDALMLPPLVARIAAEERLLQAQFGAAYDAYRARTWRLLPWVW